MNFRIAKFLDNFLFSPTRRRLTYSLLALYLVVAGAATIYITKNADRLVGYDFETDLIIHLDQPNETQTELTDQGQVSSSTAQNSTSKKPDSKNSTSSSGSSSSVATDSTDSSSSGTSGDTAESLSVYTAFYADNQSDSDADDAIHLSVVNKILATGANPVFHAGDLMEDGTADSLNRFNNVAGSMLSARTFYGALGNNDRVYGDSSTPSQLYLDNFIFPNNERWYSVNTGNLHLIILDSAFAASDPSQLAWLESDLQSAAAQSRLIGVVFHHPTFFSTISSYLINNGVDFAVAGHIHTYSKTSSSGLNLFTLPGGTSLGYATASVYSSYAVIRVYNSAGNLIEATTVSNR